MFRASSSTLVRARRSFFEFSASPSKNSKDVRVVNAAARSLMSPPTPNRFTIRVAAINLRWLRAFFTTLDFRAPRSQTRNDTSNTNDFLATVSNIALKSGSK